jgi:hypothetical protein
VIPGENCPAVARQNEFPDRPEFAAQNRADSDVTLTDAPEQIRVRVNAAVDLTRGDLLNDLPPYPKAFGEPEVAIDWDGGLRTSIHVGDEFYEFWSNEEGDHYNDVYGDGLSATFEYDEEREAFIEWGNAVHDRIDSNAYAVIQTSVMGVEDKIVNTALGRPVSPVAASEI